MKRSKLIRALASTAAVALAPAALGDDTLAHQQAAELFGAAAERQVAERVLRLEPGWRYLNVRDGETVTIVNAARQFTWRFDAPSPAMFPLARIAPKDFGTGHVQVHVSPDVRTQLGD